ncbi:pyridoxamine 5'-phosphate oxidase family protein [Slackia heliotrinireducens]|uniref:pyridoxamine 5'-phosphate oxidase family protein n=1 Tax=Slackia heliotrinireducens TaxID=84110 RepID=UPI0033159687
MNLIDCFKYLVDDIHTVVIATVDDAGRPQTRAIDLLGYDEGGVYFSTGAGKAFCRELEAQGYVALTGMKGESTMERVAASMRGEVRACGPQKADELLDANPYMAQLYPTPESRATVRTFYLFKGSFDWFDLRTSPMTRLSFTFGGHDRNTEERCAAMAKNLLNMLLLEAPRHAEQAAPDTPEAREALIQKLLAARGDAPMSADLYEAWTLYQSATK